MTLIGYSAVLVILSAGLVSCQTGGNSSTSGSSNVPLSFLRREGFMADSQNHSKMMDRMMSDKRKILAGRASIVDLTTINRGEDSSGMTNIGEADITTLERSDMSTAGMLSHAGCQPYDQVVDIPNPDPNVVMYPACVVVKRCGGCCGHPSLTCRAISKGSTKAMVMRYVYDGTLRPARQVTYEQIEYHKTCECGCKIEEKHCNAQLHNYDNFDCKCVCKNDHQARSCPTNKRWNPDLCACQCIEISNCGASYVFDPELCRCVPGFENSGSNNNGFSSSNNNGAIGPLTAAPQPDNKVTVTETVDPCSHLQCPASYTTMMRRGRCRCVVNRG